MPGCCSWRAIRPARPPRSASRAVRGTFDHGDVELRSLVEALVDRLGRTEYDRAYRQGVDMTRQEAIDRLTKLRS
ncbi:hypothetical protein GCM10010404_75410 [Nonomuraea africana]